MICLQPLFITNFNPTVFFKVTQLFDSPIRGHVFCRGNRVTLWIPRGHLNILISTCGRPSSRKGCQKRSRDVFTMQLGRHKLWMLERRDMRWKIIWAMKKGYGLACARGFYSLVPARHFWSSNTWATPNTPVPSPQPKWLLVQCRTSPCISPQSPPLTPQSPVPNLNGC